MSHKKEHKKKKKRRKAPRSRAEQWDEPVTEASDENYEVESADADIEDEEGEVPESPASLQALQVEANKFTRPPSATPPTTPTPPSTPSLVTPRRASKPQEVVAAHRKEEEEFTQVGF